MADGPIEPALVVCECGDLQTLHRFGAGACLRVRRGVPCECPKYREPAAVGTAAAGGPSLVEQWTVKPNG
jgi:hypothetical protein